MTESVDALRRMAAAGEAGAEPPPVERLRARGRRRRLRRRGVLALVPVAAAGALAAGVALAASGGPVDRLATTGGGQPVVPGASSPSPFASDPGYRKHREPNLCTTDLGPGERITAPVSYDDMTFTPPGDATTPLSAPRVRAIFGASDLGRDGTPDVIRFGRLSADTPARIQPDGRAVPEFADTPVWVVAICGDAPAMGSPGGLAAHPDYGGTKPSPGPPALFDLIATFDAHGRPVGVVSMDGRPSPEQLATTYVTVPWRRTGRDFADGRRIGISYPAAESCATFDHLAVAERGDAVSVQVWLRVPPNRPASCSGTARHDAVVGLAKPLGTRPLVAAPFPRPALPPGKLGASSG